jgi:hypothetical protein
LIELGGLCWVVDFSDINEFAIAPKFQKQVLLSTFFREVVVYHVKLL